MSDSEPIPISKDERDLWAMGFTKEERSKIIELASATGFSPVLLGQTIKSCAKTFMEGKNEHHQRT
jgi:hypothetical protein